MRTSIVPVRLALMTVVSLSACAHRYSEEVPPSNAKPLSEIVRSLEDQGYNDVERIKFDDNVWVIDVHRAGGKKIKLHVNPVSGHVVKSG